MTSHKPTTIDRDYLVFGLILILAAFHGLLFVFLIPPWQHYDEPNHFEKVWLTANLDHLPTPADYSPKLSRQVVKSMIENRFYSEESTPVVGPPSEKIKIPGYSQLSEPPFYYLIASLPLRLIPDRGVDAQLYSARLVSLLFFLLTVVSGYCLACELKPKGHPLRWMLPLALALLPAFVDLMTAVNNDVAAIAMSSVFLFLCVRMIRRGFSFVDFLSLCLVSGLVYLSKVTAIEVFVVLPFTLLFSLLRGEKRRIAWGAALLIILCAAAITLRWDDAFAWYRNTSQPGPTRVRSEQAPWGKYVFSVDPSFESTPRGFPPVYQNMPVQKATGFEEKQVTYGYWIWADKSSTVENPLTLRTPGASFSDTLEVSQSPTFHAWVVTLPVGTTRLWIDLNPLSAQPGDRIYYDGLLLAEGAFPVDEPLLFSGPDAKTGTWGGRPFENALLNPSAETGGPRASPLIDNLGARFLPDSTRPSLILASLVDLQGTRNLYPLTARHLFQTFWARFGWGNVPLLGGSIIYPVLMMVSILMLAFAVARALRQPGQVPWDATLVVALVAVISILMALTRAVVYLPVNGFYIATARYFYPVVIPLMLVFSVGWLEMSYWLSRLRLRLQSRQNSGQESLASGTADSFSFSHFFPFFAFFMGLSILSLISIIRFYY